jgi:UDP-glucose 4-epimerase
MKLLITGGAGFIGSHLVDHFATQGHDVTIVDNLSLGARQNVASWQDTTHVHLQIGDCTNPEDVQQALTDHEVILHFAANPEVRISQSPPATCFTQNVYATYLLLEAWRQSPATTLVFASSSTVYGDPQILPTPESHVTLPISIYGASKLASEALIIAYAHTYNKHAIILRLANIIGPRSQHGVIADFIAKLRQTPQRLEILGDGTQTKSYLHVRDCVAAISALLNRSLDPVTILNLGSDDQTSVTQIADMIVEEMQLPDVTYAFTGGVDAGRGWKGDVKTMLLDIRRMNAQGWNARYSSHEAVRQTVQAMLRDH